jgi:hypothetical protein
MDICYGNIMQKRCRSFRSFILQTAQGRMKMALNPLAIRNPKLPLGAPEEKIGVGSKCGGNNPASFVG